MQNSGKTVRIGDRIEMEKVTVCKECEFANLYGGPRKGKPTGFCLNKDAPIFDFVRGTKSCIHINRGDCKFFKPLTTNGYAGNSNKGE